MTKYFADASGTEMEDARGECPYDMECVDEIVTRAVAAEREACAGKAREIAAHYPEASDGRNTFIILAEWIEKRNAST
jgi:hypothetical protein